MQTRRAPEMTKVERRQYLELLETHPAQYLRIAEDTIRKYPDDTEGYEHCADYYSEMERYDEALRYLDKVLELDPDKIVIRFERGTVLHCAGRYREALQAFDEVGPTDREWFGDIMLVSRATCHAYLGDLEAALAECAKIADDYSFPSLYGEFGGTKAQIIETVRRVAGAVRKD